MISRVSYRCLFTFACCSYGWSGIGHDTIGRIALKYVDDKTRLFVVNGLGSLDPNDLDGDMIDAGRWADQVPDDMNWSRKYHFASTPTRQCVGFDYNRDCSGCIVSAIANYTIRAINTNLTFDERFEALRFVIHFMGDIHIPMHLGFKGDAGGNGISITGIASQYPVNLHNVWDYHILQRFNLKALVSQSTDNGQYDSLFDSLTPEDISYQTMLELATSMAFETNQIACTSAYRHMACSGPCWIESGDSLEDDYWNTHVPVAQTQLELAGKRLAALLTLMASATPVSFDSSSSAVWNVWTNFLCLFITYSAICIL